MVKMVADGAQKSLNYMNNDDTSSFCIASTWSNEYLKESRTNKPRRNTIIYISRLCPSLQDSDPLRHQKDLVLPGKYGEPEEPHDYVRHRPDHSPKSRVHGLPLMSHNTLAVLPDRYRRDACVFEDGIHSGAGVLCNMTDASWKINDICSL